MEDHATGVSPPAPTVERTDPAGTRRRGPLRTRRNASAMAATAAVALVVIGIVLIVTATDRSTPAGPTTTIPTGSPTGNTLPLDDTSRAGVERLAGVRFPAGTDGFLSARLDTGTQLDVTFTLPVAASAGFVSSSSLPPPQPGRRVVTHSSPLWKLNPGGTVSGSTDTRGSVRRAVEFVAEGDRVRVRLVLSPAS